MRLVAWWLRRVAGDELARDIIGDVAESGGAVTRLIAIAWTLTARKAAEAARLAFGRRRSDRIRAECWHAIRSLRRSPAYSVTVIAVLALTGALATAAFAVVDGVLFKPLPYPSPADLWIGMGPGGRLLSAADLETWRRVAPEANISLMRSATTLGAMGDVAPRPIQAAQVGARFFEVLGQRPAIGGWADSDFVDGGPRVRVLITHAMWRQFFGGDRAALGRVFEVSGASDRGRPLPSFEVAGILPKNFVFPSGTGTPDLLLPLVIPSDRNTSRNDGGIALMRVPSPSASLTENLTQAYGPLPPGDEASPKDAKVSIGSVPVLLLQYQKDSLRSAFAASGLLMMLAVLNVAGLSVMRSRQRGHEFGIRRALGASRFDLFRLTLIDAAPLVLAGMLGALMLAPWAIAAATALLPSSIVFLKTPEIDWRVTIFWLVLMIITLFSCSAASVLWGSPANTISASRRGGQHTVQRGRFGRAVIAVQVALAFVITLGGMLLGATLWRLWQQPIGFPLRDRAVLELSFRDSQPAARPEATAALVRLVRGVSGVERVAVVSAGGSFLTRSRRVMSFSLPTGIRPGREGFWPVSTGFFDLMELRPVAGRLFSESEVAGHARVLILSETVARRYFPKGQPLGAVLTTNRTRAPIAYTVVGVVPDVQLSGLADVTGGQIYEPGLQLDQQFVLLVQGRARLAAIVGAVVSARSTGIIRAKTLVAAMGGSVQMTMFRTWLFAAFTICALVIVGVGIFGIIAMSVSSRTRELGIRSALGARRHLLIRLFVSEQMIAVMTGLVLGGALGAYATSIVKAYLFGVSLANPLIWSATAAVILIVSALAALIPATRASRINPVDALRVE